MRQVMALIVIFVATTTVALAQTPVTFTVDNTGDATPADPADCTDATAGNCNLRDAIAAANAAPNTEDPIIEFDTGVFNSQTTISVVDDLPVLTQENGIDIIGLVDSGTLLVRIDRGSGGDNGLELGGDGGHSIQNLEITGFVAGAGIFIQDSNDNEILNSHIGLTVDPGGNATADGNGDGVFIFQGNNNQIGAPGAGNIISGNEGIGIDIDGFFGGSILSEGNVVQANLIGTTPDGESALPNDEDGILLESGAFGNLVGTDSDGNNDAAERNIISGNGLRGVFIPDDTGGNTVSGNYIGTDIDGEAAIPNGDQGITVQGVDNCIGGRIDGGTCVAGSAVAGNVISGNDGTGLLFDDATSQGNVARDNLIGVAADGTTPLGNGNNGITFDDGASNNTVRQGIVANNDQRGVRFTDNSSDNRVIDAEIRDNTTTGVTLDNGATDNLVRNSVISGNGSNGVLLSGTNTQNNIIRQSSIVSNGDDGVYFSGSARFNEIRDGQISDNSGAGVFAEGGGTRRNIISGNNIGTGADGTGDQGNTGDGIRLQSGASQFEISDNVIAFNGGDGIFTNQSGSQLTITGNFFNTDRTGTLPQPNDRDGVRLAGDAGNNTITGNTFAFGDSNGIHIAAPAGVSPQPFQRQGNNISQNVFYDNAEIGIDLVVTGSGVTGPTPNDVGDADTGPNQLQNTVEIVDVYTDGTTMRVFSTLESYDGAGDRTYTVEFFGNNAADCATPAAGTARVYLGTADVTGEGTLLDFPLDFALAATMPLDCVTATVTGRLEPPFTTGLRNTSEISTAVVALASSDVAIVHDIDTSPVMVGDTVTYTTTLTSIGVDDAADIVLTIDVPAEVNNLSVDNAACSVNLQTITCDFTSLAVGDDIVITTEGEAAAEAVDAVSTATVAARNDLNDANDTDDALVTILPLAMVDVAVAHTVDPTTVTVGGGVAYTTTLTNNGPDDAENITLDLVFPVEVDVQSVDEPACTITASTISCDIASLPQGDTRTITTQADAITVGADVESTADITVSGDTDPANDTASALLTIVPVMVDVGLTHMVAPSTVTLGDSVTYTTTLTNGGPDDADTFTLDLDFPAAVDVQSVDEPACTIIGNSINCDIALLAVGETLTINTEADTLAEVADAESTAEVTVADDTNAANDTASAFLTVVPLDVDVSVAHAASASIFTEGDPITYTTTVANSGPGDADDITLTIVVPPQVAITSVDSPLCTLNGQTITCDITALAPGESLTITTSAEAVDEVQSAPSTASIVVASDTTPGNNSATVFVTIDGVPGDGDDPVVIGVPTATPTGPAGQTLPTATLAPTQILATQVVATEMMATEIAATDIVATDIVATEMMATDIAATDIIATEIMATQVVATEMMATDIAATAIPATEIAQTAVAIATSGVPESFVEPEEVELDVVQTLDDGEMVLTVRNVGTEDLENVRVISVVPGNVDVQLPVRRECVKVGQQVRCDLGRVPAGSSIDVRLLLESLDDADPVLVQAFLESDSLPEGVDLGQPYIVKVAAPPFVPAGGPVTYTIQIVNAGADTVNDLEVIDNLPPSIRIVDVAASVGEVTVDADGRVVVRIDELAGTSFARLTVSTIFAPNADTPPIVSNEACLTYDGATQCVQAPIVQASVLPTTGQTPRWALFVWIGLFVTIVVVYWFILKRGRQDGVTR